jgi:hypothetical protein
MHDVNITVITTETSQKSSQSITQNFSEQETQKMSGPENVMQDLFATSGGETVIYLYGSLRASPKFFDHSHIRYIQFYFRTID